ncbi:MAG: site-specific integrase [Clostridia bacterium]|nr:site-specific integrase [Clostridia bacterium]
MGRRSNGEGTIYYSERLKKWVGQFTANSKRKSIYGNTKREVIEKMHKNLVNLQENKFIDKSRLTISAILDLMLQEEEKANRVSENTLLRKEATAKIIKKMYIAEMPIQKVTAVQINTCLLDLVNYSNSYISKICMLLNNVFNKAMLLNIINLNPFTIKGNIVKPKSNNADKKVEAFTIEEQKKFLQQLKNKDYMYKDVFYILIETGMRVGEVLALKREDIDFKNNIIHVKRTLTRDRKDFVKLGDRTKTYAGIRDIPMSAVVKNILKNNNNINFLFLMQNGKFIPATTINGHFKRICKDAHIRECIYEFQRNGRTIHLKLSKVNTHMLRHTYATRCIEAGISPVVLQRILGHKDIETTLNTYTSVFNKFKEEEIEKVNTYLEAMQLH